jgi:hypothetical protein
MIKILRRAQGTDFFIVDMGMTVPALGELVIDPAQYSLLARSSDVIIALANSDLVFNDGSNDITDVAYATLIIQGGTPQVDVKTEPPFAAKVIDGKSIYNRTHGTPGFAVTASTRTECKFTVPFPVNKFDGIEIIGGEIGDNVDLYVWDSVNGDYNNEPNSQLNQFGYTVNVAPGHYNRKSRYDADLFIGMQIVVDYYSVSNKTIYINWDIHELKA